MTRLRRRIFTPILTLCAIGTFLSTAVYTQTSNAADAITAEKVKPHIVKLADDRLEGRGAGYKGEREAAEYIAGEFKRIGLKPVGDASSSGRSYFQEFKFQPYHPVKPWEVMTSRNILGFIEGDDPTLKNEVIIIGAHYDGQGRTGQADPTRKPAAEGSQADEIWNSANDNATSVAAIIEIARAIRKGGIKPKRSILFIAFGAEEHGMTGSIYYVNHPAFPLASSVAMINLEKLGRSPEKPLNVTGVRSSKIWPEAVKSAQDSTKAVIASNPFAFPDSDHYPFGSVHIPAIIVAVSSSDDIHQPSDSSDKIDFARTAEAARFAQGVLLYVADAQTRPDFSPSVIPDVGLIAHLITSAEADAAGLAAGESGLKVTGVVAGLPSAEAGLVEGDLILQVGTMGFHREDTIAALMSMQMSLLQGKMGTTIPIKIVRNKQRMALTLKLRQ